MNATGLPIPSSGSAAPAGSTPAPAGAAQVSSEDFLLMLGQLLGCAVPVQTAAPGAASKTVPETTTGKDTDSTEADGAALAAMLPFASVPLQVPAQPDGSAVTGQGGGDGADVKSVSLDAVAGRNGLLDLLTTDKSKSADDAGAPASNNNSTAAALLDTSQAAKTAPAATDPGNANRPMHNAVGTNAWADELGSRLTMMADRGQHSASLRLSPEHLGPLEVRIAVRDDQASVWFGAAHADTRAAIEQALPRLRELFASQGLSLADAGVFREPPREQPRMPAPFSASSGGSSDAVEPVHSIPARLLRVGLVDAYA